MNIFENLIDEKEYDPAGSEKLGEWSPSELSGGFRFETETLYRTGKGNYFILRQGGLFSREHAFQGGETWYGGSSMRPVTEEEAYAWCCETGNYEAVDRHFFLLKIMN